MFRTYNAHTHVLYGVCPSNQLHFNKYEHGYDYGHKRGSSKPNKLFIFNLKDHVRIFLFQLFGAHCAHVCAFEVWCTKRLLFLFYFYSFSLNFTYYSRFFFSAIYLIQCRSAIFRTDFVWQWRDGKNMNKQQQYVRIFLLLLLFLFFSLNDTQNKWGKTFGNCKEFWIKYWWTNIMCSVLFFCSSFFHIFLFFDDDILWVCIVVMVDFFFSFKIYHIFFCFLSLNIGSGDTRHTLTLTEKKVQQFWKPNVVAEIQNDMCQILLMGFTSTI